MMSLQSVCQHFDLEKHIGLQTSLFYFKGKTTLLIDITLKYDQIGHQRVMNY